MVGRMSRQKVSGLRQGGLAVQELILLGVGGAQRTVAHRSAWRNLPDLWFGFYSECREAT